MSKISMNKYNIKTYIIYKMFSWDLLFYYAIIYLFLTLNKGLRPSDVLLIDAIFEVAKLVFQLPSTGIVDLIGHRRSLIFADFIMALAILLLILSTNIATLIWSNIIMAFAFNIKDICEGSILDQAIPYNRRKHQLFSKYDGRGLACFYWFDAISAAITGFLFIVNDYLPLIMCFTCCCISTLIAFKFKPIENDTKKINLSKDTTINYIKEVKNIFSFILHSKRLKGLLIYSGIFTAQLLLFINVRVVALTELNIKEEYLGLVVAGIQMLSAITAKRANKIQNRYKNRTLTVFAFTTTVPLIFLGLSLLCNLPIYISITLVVIWLILYAQYKGPYYTLIKRYLQSFSTASVTTKIFGIHSFLSCTFAALFSYIVSVLLEHFTVPITILSVGIGLSSIFLILLDYMKSHVGLKPEEYKKSEIEYTELH